METTKTDGWARPEEQAWVRRAHEWAESVQQDQVWKRTDFLSPRELHILESVSHHHGLVVASFGGTAFAERKRALIMPDEWYPQDDDFQVATLSVQNGRNTTMSHGSILGSVLGTGLDRRKVGDIFTQRTGAVLAVCQDVANFLLGQWHTVGRDGVIVEMMDTEQLDLEEPAYELRHITVASLRLDAVIAQTCQWSRSTAQSSITSGNVSLNFMEWTKPDAAIEEGDIVSVRGFGRIRIQSMSGLSKRGRARLEVGVLRSNQRNLAE